MSETITYTTAGGTATTVTVDLVLGSIPTLKPAIEVWAASGYDGVGAIDHGLADGRFNVRAIVRVASASAQTTRDALDGLQGAVATISQETRSYTGCLIERVRLAPTTPSVRPPSETTHVRIEAAIEGTRTA